MKRCRKLIDADLVPVDSSNHERIKHSCDPRTFNNLRQYVYSFAQMGLTVLYFAEQVGILYDLIEDAYK